MLYECTEHGLYTLTWDSQRSKRASIVNVENGEVLMCLATIYNHLGIVVTLFITQKNEVITINNDLLLTCKVLKALC